MVLLVVAVSLWLGREGWKGFQRASLKGRTPEGIARQRLSETYNWLRIGRQDHSEEEALREVYAAAVEFTAGRNEPVVISAEKVLHKEQFRERILLKFLITEHYIKAHTWWPPSHADALQRYGSSFELFALPPERDTNLSTFVWCFRHRPDQMDAYGFPFLWAKRPDLYDGHRPCIDYRRSGSFLREVEFADYLQGAKDWVTGNRPLAEIDRMLGAHPHDDVMLNGLTLLRRHPDANIRLERLQRMAEITMPQVRSRVTEELGLLAAERAITVLGKAAESSASDRQVLVKEQVKSVADFARLETPDSPDARRRDLHWIKLAFVNCLATMRGPESDELLRELAVDDDQSVSRAACQWLRARSNP